MIENAIFNKTGVTRVVAKTIITIIVKISRKTFKTEIGFCQNGRAFPSKEYTSEGVRLLRPGNLHVSGGIEWTENNTRYMPESWATAHPDYVIGGGELVINLTAQSLKDEFLGRVCMTSSAERCLLNQRIARLTPVEVDGDLWLLLQEQALQQLRWQPVLISSSVWA